MSPLLITQYLDKCVISKKMRKKSHLHKALIKILFWLSLLCIFRVIRAIQFTCSFQSQVSQYYIEFVLKLSMIHEIFIENL